MSVRMRVGLRIRVSLMVMVRVEGKANRRLNGDGEG